MKAIIINGFRGSIVFFAQMSTSTGAIAQCLQPKTCSEILAQMLVKQNGAFSVQGKQA